MKIKDLQNRDFAEVMLGKTLAKIYKIGPVDATDYEILSYISIFHPNLIKLHIDDIILYMGLFYKSINNPESLQGCVQKMFLECIAEHYGEKYTPVQTSILNNSEGNKIFSFSAPTSTGKSHVLFSIIEKSEHDVVVVVPSRALINEYYLRLCEEIPDAPELAEIIKELRDFTGGETIAYKNYYSQMLDLLKRGIVIHHGSLPLKARMLVEKFTRKHFCRICFATSTLEQGINMPFDIVYIDRLESSKHLAVKNLIGRAGRSSHERRIDYGIVIIASSKVSKFRDALKQPSCLKEQSQLDDEGELNEDDNDFKDAILHDTFSDQFNLTQNQIAKLSDTALNDIIKCVLDRLFNNIDENGNVNLSKEDRKAVVEAFHQLYSNYLERPLQQGEKSILTTAFNIMIWRIQGRTFSTICHSRYAYISREKERAKLEKLGQSTDDLPARFSQKYEDLPNNKLFKSIPLFLRGLKAKDVDYDIITYDTYDYLDKLIGLYLVDIFYAAFIKYNERCQDERAVKMANLIKFGTYNPKYIWMLRYGMSFEDIEVLEDYIESIDEQGITC